MNTGDERMALWVDVLADALQKPLTSYPRAPIMAALGETFEVTGVMWRWSDGRGLGVEMTPGLANRFAGGYLAEPVARHIVARHGLIRWFVTTNDPKAQTLARVPTSIASRADQAAVRELLAPAECEQLMCIPYRWEWPHYSAFVLARTGSDFTSEDLHVTRRVQRVLWAIEAQVRILGARDREGVSLEEAAATNLSGRELAVLHLLARGLTAEAIGRRLGASPRTVQKHLQHIYQKLGVNDRMSAVRVASRRQLLTSPGSVSEKPSHATSVEVLHLPEPGP